MTRLECELCIVEIALATTGSLFKKLFELGFIRGLMTKYSILINIPQVYIWSNTRKGIVNIETLSNISLNHISWKIHVLYITYVIWGLKRWNVSVFKRTLWKRLNSLNSCMFWFYGRDSVDEMYVLWLHGRDSLSRWNVCVLILWEGLNICFDFMGGNQQVKCVSD